MDAANDIQQRFNQLRRKLSFFLRISQDLLYGRFFPTLQGDKGQ